MATAKVTFERVLEQQEVDAGLYLLQRMLNLDDSVLGAKRIQLLAMKKRLERDGKINSDDKKRVVATYREVIG